ncbi:hypothetical protein HDV05_003386 [Chytridiales sp. JEL 0842]|nr:hypothetical protein HDV05_003386 [Chytridiales sp. JEL 0842]
MTDDANKKGYPTTIRRPPIHIPYNAVPSDTILAHFGSQMRDGSYRPNPYQYPSDPLSPSPAPVLFNGDSADWSTSSTLTDRSYAYSRSQFYHSSNPKTYAPSLYHAKERQFADGHYSISPQPIAPEPFGGLVGGRFLSSGGIDRHHMADGLHVLNDEDDSFTYPPSVVSAAAAAAPAAERYNDFDYTTNPRLQRFIVKDDYDDSVDMVYSNHSQSVCSDEEDVSVVPSPSDNLQKTESATPLSPIDDASTKVEETTTSPSVSSPNTVDKLLWIAVFTIASLAILNMVPPFSILSRMLRRSLGHYMASAFILSASNCLGYFASQQREHFPRAIQTITSNQESNAFMIATIFFVVSLYIIPISFSMLHYISLKLPIIGPVAVFLFLATSSIVLSFATFGALVYYSWDITKVVHSVVISVVKYTFGGGGKGKGLSIVSR